MAPEVDRTWDGLEIASDHPRGATICVRRTTTAGDTELLVLHRSHHGPDFAGDWAWTAPAGCRHPGEVVYACALRELAEESGISDCRPWAVDLSSTWALFGIDVPIDVPVDLVDPEHDRFAWVTPLEAGHLIGPAFVAEQQLRAAAVPAATITFRPLTDGDFPLMAQWHTTPHVAAWWDDRSPDEASVRARYTPAVRGEEAVRMWIVEVDARPAGFLQDYRVADHPEYAALTGDPEAVAFDYALGEPGLVGRGLGTRMVWEFCRRILHRDYPAAPRFIASPSYRNAASLRVLAKCGFRTGATIASSDGEGDNGDDEIVCSLDVAHWLG